MKQSLRESGLSIAQRSREMLAGLTKKAQTAFAVRPDQEDTENIEIVDKGTQRLAQTQFGRLLLRWSKPRPKRKKKRRFPVFNLILLVLFAIMVVISLVGSHNSASAANSTTTSAANTANTSVANTTTTSAASTTNTSASHTTSTSAAVKTDAPPTNNGPTQNGKCPDGSALDSNDLCAPGSFDPLICSKSDQDTSVTDPCNPWGEYSNYGGTDGATLASEWEDLGVYDQVCVYTNGLGTKTADYNIERSLDKPAFNLRNTDLSWRASTLVPYSETTEISIACYHAGSGTFPCAQDEAQVAGDWLSGWPPPPATANSDGDAVGHLETTYPQETVDNSNVQSVYTYMLMVGFMLLIPGIILCGYRLIISGSTFRHAEALAILPRIILAAAAVAVCASLVGMLIDFSNDVSSSVVALHTALPYPQTKQPVTNSDGSVSYYIGYTLVMQNGNIVTSPSTSGNSPTVTVEPSDSYRGIVVPINRWGCAANDFVSILSASFWTNVFASIIPFFGNFISLAEKVTSAIGIVHNLGEFIQTILSVGLAAQVIFRIIMINFYILTGPLACGCWALPGDTGQGVFGQWLKGIFSLLLTQAAQLFILTVTPLIMPDFSQMNLPLDSMGLLKSIFSALPAIIVLIITLQVPKFIGTSATKAVAAAGTMASGAVAAGAAAAYSITGG